MAKKKDEEEVQITPELEVELEPQPEQPQATIVDQRDMPLALKNLIDASNKTLQETQQRLIDVITSSADDLMSILGIDPAEGWLVDLDNQRFVKIERPSEEDSK